MKTYKQPNVFVHEMEFEDILESSLTDLEDGILDFDADPDEIV